MSHKAQLERVKEYMIAHGSITIREALNDLGVYSLSSRISQLIKLGFPITKGWHELTNRYGESIKIRRYYYGERTDD